MDQGSMGTPAAQRAAAPHLPAPGLPNSPPDLSRFSFVESQHEKPLPHTARSVQFGQISPRMVHHWVHFFTK